MNNPKLQSSAISPLSITLQQEEKHALDLAEGQGRRWYAAERELGQEGRLAAHGGSHGPSMHGCAAQGQHETHTVRGRPSGHACHTEPRWWPSARVCTAALRRLCRRPGVLVKEFREACGIRRTAYGIRRTTQRATKERELRRLCGISLDSNRV